MNEKEALEHFDRIFGTNTIKNIRLEDMKLLKILFEKFEEDLYELNSRHKQLVKENIKILDKLEETFTEEQKKLFEKVSEINSEMTAEENEKFFLFGYIVAKELEYESKIKKD